MCYSAMVEQNEKRLAQHLKALPHKAAYDRFQRLQMFEQEIGASGVKDYLGLARTPRVSQFRWGPDQKDCRIYPGYFAPVIVMQDGLRTMEPMRYRIRPSDSKMEIPSKYNVFNCRLDAISSRRTWKPLFGKNHGLFPFIKFYEWVDRGKQGKVEISFEPEGHEIMWAPALFDVWESPDKNIEFKSFAIITDEPPLEVRTAGHDRCPIFLKSEAIDAWLTPENKSKDELMEILQQREPAYYLNSLQ